MSRNTRTALLLAAVALAFFIAVIIRQVMYGLPG
ncbi:cytochrome oxidase small assembly protein [Jeongeupia sp. HS-3]|nr:cytochrome oxidase small assembly protein [Jeongeupia sp. HS-3]